MIREYFIHHSHRLKHYLSVTRPFTGRGILMKWTDKIIGIPRKPIILKTLHGFKLHIDPILDNGVEKSIFYNGTYEAGTLDIFKKILRKGDVVLDVGANIGLMTLVASLQVGATGKVHAFEPEPDTYKILKRNLQINNANNVIVNNLALGSKDEEGVIYPNISINRGASSIVRQDGTSGKNITITTLENYLLKNNLPEIRLVKIDIEGFELEMLKGAKELLQLKDAPIICIEYSRDVVRDGDVGDVYDYLKNINEYRLFRFVAWKEKVSQLTEVTSKDDMPFHDNVFCFLPQHLSEIKSNIFKSK